MVPDGVDAETEILERGFRHGPQAVLCEEFADCRGPLADVDILAAGCQRQRAPPLECCSDRGLSVGAVGLEKLPVGIVLAIADSIVIVGMEELVGQNRSEEHTSEL